MAWGSLSGSQRIQVLLTLLGGPEYRAQMAASSASTRRFGQQVEASSLAMRTASRRTFLASQALYTFRRYAFFGTVAALGLTAAVAKLGFSYLTTRDSARAALRPVFQNTQDMNRELDYLFTLSKYSPFVLKDFTDAFRVMYPALHNAGMSLGNMNDLMKTLSDVLSASGRTTPAALQRISYAIQHMISQGRLTGILVRSLAAAGVPVNLLLKQLGVAGTNLSNIARLNISPDNVINALIKVSRQNAFFRDAARRVSTGSVLGMFQVFKDSLSQLMGQMMEGPYNRFRARLKELVGPGGFFDQMGKIKGTHNILMGISVGLTGGTGLGKGFELLLETLKNIGRVFTNLVVPAFLLGLRALVVFAPAIVILNSVLGFMADHATLLKWVLAILAAQFVITHGAMLGMWAGGKLLNIMLFGQINVLKKLITTLFVAEFRTKAIARAMRLWTIIQKGAIFVTRNDGRVVKATWVQYSRWELAIIRVRTAILTGLIPAITAWIAENELLTASIFGIPVIGWILLAITAIAILIYRWRGLRVAIVNVLKDIGSAIYNNLVKPIERAFNWVQRLIRPLDRILGIGGGGGGFGQLVTNPGVFIFRKILGFAEGGTTPYAGRFMVGERGAEIIDLPKGSNITPVNRTVSPIAALSGQNREDGKPIVVQLVVDRRVLAESVVRAQQDKKARG